MVTMIQQITGKYYDALTSIDSDNCWKRGWCSNRIVSRSNVLLAALMKGEVDLQGILYLAIGEGNPDWDDAGNPVTPDVQQLHNEVLRHPLAVEEITFLDPLDQPSATPSSRLEIAVDFIGNDIVETGYQSLREFGLFGGDATASANSGYLINYVIHPRIDMTPNATLTRKLHLDFDSPAPAATAIPAAAATTNWLSDAPVKLIDGVGKTYISALTAAGIKTIGELASSELETKVSMPGMKFMEIRARAQIAIQSISTLNPTDAMLPLKFKQFFSTPTGELAIMLGANRNTVLHACNQLCMLQLALDQKFLQNKTIGELNNILPLK